nr:hypothetical protein [uncultured Albidiferax sp.]
MISASSKSLVMSLVAEIRGRNDWFEFLQSSQAQGSTLPKGQRELQPVFAQMRAELKVGRTAVSLAVCRVLAYLDRRLFVREARRHGLFRASKNDFHAKPIDHILATLLGDVTRLQFSDDERAYFLSVRGLVKFSVYPARVRRQLIAELQRRKPVAIKSLLVCVDRAFRPPIDDQLTEEERHAAAIGHPDFFHREQKASAFSTIVSLMREVVGISPLVHGFVDEVGVLDGTYDRLLLAAFKVWKFLEAETTVDAFPYAFELSTNGKRGNLVPTDPLFEQSVQLGYIQAHAQNYILRDSLGELSAIPSLEELTLKLFNEFGHRWGSLKGEPLPRYRMELPLTPPVLTLLSAEELFREEVFIAEHTRGEAFLDDASVLEMVVSDGLTVLDVIRFRRFVDFITTMFFAGLERPAPGFDRNVLDMRSRIIVFREEDLLTKLASVTGAEKAGKLLTTFGCDLEGSGHVDLQYQPLLKAQGYYMLPAGVLVMSDLIRSALFVSGKKLSPSDGHEPMLRRLRDAFHSKGFLAAEGVKGTFQGRPIELDLVAFKDGHLFIFEGKNGFHPCSPQEMRTTYDHIQKATMQLQRAEAWLATGGVVAEMFRKLHWQAQAVTAIRTCTVTANRLFNGYELCGHPVRQAHELLNVLLSGEAHLSTGESYSMWSGIDFNVQDLCSHLSDSTFFRDLFDSMESFEVSIEVAGGDFSVTTYALDFVALNLRLEQHYRSINPPDSFRSFQASVPSA